MSRQRAMITGGNTNKGMLSLLKAMLLGVMSGTIPGGDRALKQNFGLSRRALGLAGRSKYKPHQGAQERARRARQIERGILKP